MLANSHRLEDFEPRKGQLVFAALCAENMAAVAAMMTSLGNGELDAALCAIVGKIVSNPMVRHGICKHAKCER